MSKIKLVKLLAYHYAQTTEPEEAVRHAFADIFGTRVHLEEPRINAWIPEKYDARTVLATADLLLRNAIGAEMASAEDSGQDIGATTVAGASPAMRTVRGAPLKSRDVGEYIVKTTAPADIRTSSTDNQLAPASSQAGPRPGVNNRQIDDRFNRKQWDWVRNVDERNNSVSFITGSDTIAIDASSIAHPLTNQFYYKVFATPLNEDESPQPSLATRKWFDQQEYTSGFTGVSYKMSNGQRVIQANAPGAKKFKWTIVLPPQESAHGNVAPNSHMLEVFKPKVAR
jgi:hypothetical protein